MWQPELQSGPLPLYERLVLALAHDIHTGLLAAGTKLPPQRDLAFRLGISVGSVTRAYVEAERRGLLTAHVGRGSFVRGASSVLQDIPAAEQGAGLEPRRDGMIDLRCNTPPPISLATDLNTTLTTLMAQGALDPAVHYVEGTGLTHVRQAAAQWIARHYGLECEAGNLIQCNGGQHGIALVFSSFCAPGDTILCESSTFYGARMAAEHLSLKMRGLPMDDEGLLPEAVDRAAAETGSRLLFLLPTLHNPTTRTMSARRRQEIAEVARARDLLILEDDAYYAYSERPKQIASYAPERTFYLASLSKGICPGLRLAFLVTPSGVPRERLMRGIRALGYCPPALGALVFGHWAETGKIDTIAQHIRREATRRWDLMRSVLGDFVASPGGVLSPHAWVPLSALDAERMTARLLRSGVEIMPPEAAAVSSSADSGLRLCLGAPATLEDLARAMKVVLSVIAGQGCTDQDGLI